jgi:hypothetical protein
MKLFAFASKCVVTDVAAAVILFPVQVCFLAIEAIEL